MEMQMQMEIEMGIEMKMERELAMLSDSQLWSRVAATPTGPNLKSSRISFNIDTQVPPLTCIIFRWRRLQGALHM